MVGNQQRVGGRGNVWAARLAFTHRYFLIEFDLLFRLQWIETIGMDMLPASRFDLHCVSGLSLRSHCKVLGIGSRVLYVSIPRKNQPL